MEESVLGTFGCPYTLLQNLSKDALHRGPENDDLIQKIYAAPHDVQEHFREYAKYEMLKGIGQKMRTRISRSSVKSVIDLLLPNDIQNIYLFLMNLSNQNKRNLSEEISLFGEYVQEAYNNGVELALYT